MTVDSVKQDNVRRDKIAIVERMENGNGIEIGSTAVAAQFKAMVESRFIMALKFPRNWDEVRQELIKECERPVFALDKSTYYVLPIGNGVEGLGIRFAEAAMRCMRNIIADAFTIQENENERVVYCFVFDIEGNGSWGKTVTIKKTVERSKPMDDGTYLSVRQNSYGKPVYTVYASDDEMARKENSWISKATRNGILRILPGWLREECEETILRIRTDKVKDDPDAAKNKIIDAFALLNISVAMLEEYLEHPVGQCTPAEIVNLQALWGAVKDGETTWRSVMDNLEDMRKMRPKPKTDAGKGTEGAKARAAEKVEVQTESSKVDAKTAPKTESKAESVTTKKAEPVEPKKETKKAAEPKAETKPAPVVEKKPEAAEVETAKEPEKSVTSPTPEAKGKVIKTKGHPEGVVFPVNINRTSDEDGYTDEQYARAETAIKQLGAQFNLQDTAMSFFSVGIEEFSAEAMAQFIAVLESWRG